MMGRIKVVLLMFLLVFTTIIGCASNEEKKAAFVDKGKAYFEKGEYKSAELEFKNAIQIDPKYIEAYEKLGETQLKLGNSKEAFKAYSVVARLDPFIVDLNLWTLSIHEVFRIDYTLSLFDLLSHTDHMASRIQKIGTLSLKSSANEPENLNS